MTTTFVELVLTTLDLWARDGTKLLQTARGTFAPYRIRNRTGGTLLMWSDIDGKAASSTQAGVKVANEETIDWRFDDWKTTREVLLHLITSLSQHSHQHTACILI